MCVQRKAYTIYGFMYHVQFTHYILDNFMYTKLSTQDMCRSVHRNIWTRGLCTLVYCIWSWAGGWWEGWLAVLWICIRWTRTFSSAITTVFFYVQIWIYSIKRRKKYIDTLFFYFFLFYVRSKQDPDQNGGDPQHCWLGSQKPRTLPPQHCWLGSQGTLHTPSSAQL